MHELICQASIMSLHACCLLKSLKSSLAKVYVGMTPTGVSALMTTEQLICTMHACTVCSVFCRTIIFILIAFEHVFNLCIPVIICIYSSGRFLRMQSPNSNLVKQFHTVHLSCSCYLERSTKDYFTKLILKGLHILSHFIYAIPKLMVSYTVNCCVNCCGLYGVHLNAPSTYDCIFQIET